MLANLFSTCFHNGQSVVHCCEHGVQPSHLKLGTYSENASDKRKHGTQRGMSEAQAREILRLKARTQTKTDIRQIKNHCYIHIHHIDLLLTDRFSNPLI